MVLEFGRDIHTEQLCAQYTQLFREPEFLFTRFSKLQLEEGFWGMISGTNWSLPQLLWEADMPFSQREKCGRSMFDLFKRFFTSDPLDTSCHMWWDALCYDLECENRLRENGGEDLQMQDVSSKHCQRSCLSWPSIVRWLRITG